MRSIKSLFLAVAATVMVIASSCTSGNKKNESENKNTDTIRAVSVKTEIAKKESIMRQSEFTATLTPFEEVHLAPSAPGRIEKINVEIGDFVSQGQVVALMDRTNLEQSRINLANLETNFRRLDTLKKTRSIADQQYDQIKSAYESARTSYQFLLENTQLKAPFAGIVSGKYFEDGEIYSGTPVATVGKPALVSIVQIHQLKALIGVAASNYPLLVRGMKAEVTSDIYPDMTFAGEIYKIYPTIDNTTKTFTVEIRILNPALKLRPGMFSKIRIDLGKGDAILIPNIALIKQTGTNDMYVFVNRNNKAVKTAVKIGRMIDDRIEISEGVSEGDEVVILGQNKLVDQVPLSIIK